MTIIYTRLTGNVNDKSNYCITNNLYLLLSLIISFRIHTHIYYIDFG